MSTVVEKSIYHSIDQEFGKLKMHAFVLRKERAQPRLARLQALRDWIMKNRPAIHQAMHDDFQKASAEVDGIELFHVLNEIKLAQDNLEDWMKPRKVDAPVTMLGTRSYIQYEPRGVCLIISPWNYPFSLAIGPLVSALAAGNSVFIKPSELTPHVSALIKRMVVEIFEPHVVQVVEGGPEVSSHLLTLPFDHIFFTGSPAIGKIVMKAAAEHLASVTLELGGKTPTIIANSANLREAAMRCAVAKFVNNGQTCIAPDYILVDEKVAAPFVAELKKQIQKLFAPGGSFEASESYCRIVNGRHFNRLNELLQDALAAGAKLEWGGKTDPASRFLHPVILTQVPANTRVMDEEIFGPILPIVTYQDIGEAITLINSKPKPLALYLFTQKNKVRDRVLTETSAGGVCVNDCGIHFLHHNLPFGGVNNSGIGKSHGHYGFLAFSNEKPVLRQKSGLTTVRAFYPPYTARSRKIMDWFLKFF